jgi:transposase
MAKIITKAVFKQYNPEQLNLLPLNLGELISPTHLVQVIHEAVGKMDLSPVINTYVGGGTSSYHPVMMTKVLLYAYAVKIYTGRKIAQALRQDVTFMWLSAMNRPDFRTINDFRSGRLKETINELFKQMLILLMEEGYINYEDYFCDGSTWSADANRHKMIWRKNAVRYQAATEKKCGELFKQIDLLNEQEEKQYGCEDLEVEGNGQKNIRQKLSDKTDTLNQIISETADKKKKRKAGSLKKQLEEKAEQINKYENQQAIAGGRSGYSVRDKDATAMRMKNKELLPAYNVLIGSEQQYITGFSVHQNPNDGTCFKEHLATLEQQAPKLPENIVADAIFGKEENYELLEGKEINSYLKYPSFHKEQTIKYRNNPFLKDHFPYHAETDSYTCPNGQHLTYQSTREQTNEKTGYTSIAKVYECKTCAGCPFALQCKKKEDANRTISVNYKLNEYKEQARNNLLSPEGVKKRKKRSCDVEPCFGDIKHNMKFRRFHLIGKKKVTSEIGIVFIAHNLRKMYLQKVENLAKAA